MATASLTYAFATDPSFFDAGLSGDLNSTFAPTDGDPPGSLEWLQSAGGTSTEKSRPAAQSWAALFGIPVGSTVTDIQCTSFKELFWAGTNVSSKQVRIRFSNSSGTIVHSAGELQDVTGAVSPTGGAPQTRGAGTVQPVDLAYQASSTTVRLEVQLDVVVAGTPNLDIEQDEIVIVITYELPLVSFAPLTRDGFGPF